MFGAARSHGGLDRIRRGGTTDRPALPGRDRVEHRRRRRGVSPRPAVVARTGASRKRVTAWGGKDMGGSLVLGTADASHRAHRRPRSVAPRLRVHLGSATYCPIGGDRVLGPLVVGDGRQVLGSTKERAIVELLALRVPHGASVDALVGCRVGRAPASVGDEDAAEPGVPRPQRRAGAGDRPGRRCVPARGRSCRRSGVRAPRRRGTAGAGRRRRRGRHRRAHRGASPVARGARPRISPTARRDRRARASKSCSAPWSRTSTRPAWRSAATPR